MRASSGHAVMHDRDRGPERVVDVEVARVHDDGVGRGLERVHLCILRVAVGRSASSTSAATARRLLRAALAPLIRHRRVRKSLTGASGKTTDPMSRPSTTAPGSAERR